MGLGHANVCECVVFVVVLLLAQYFSTINVCGALR